MSVLEMILAQTNEDVGLTAAGAIMMTVCVALVLGLNLFCLSRILRPSKNSER